MHALVIVIHMCATKMGERSLYPFEIEIYYYCQMVLYKI